MKPGNEVREGKRKEQMRRGRKESIDWELPLLLLHLLAYLPDAEEFSLCYANIALVSTNGLVVPSLPTTSSWPPSHSSGSTKSAEQTGPIPNHPACDCRDFLCGIAASRSPLLPLNRCREK